MKCLPRLLSISSTIWKKFARIKSVKEHCQRVDSIICLFRTNSNFDTDKWMRGSTKSSCTSVELSIVKGPLCSNWFASKKIFFSARKLFYGTTDQRDTITIIVRSYILLAYRGFYFWNTLLHVQWAENTMSTSSLHMHFYINVSILKNAYAHSFAYWKKQIWFIFLCVHSPRHTSFTAQSFWYV